jgi:hypothetical protein
MPHELRECRERSPHDFQVDRMKRVLLSMEQIAPDSINGRQEVNPVKWDFLCCLDVPEGTPGLITDSVVTEEAGAITSGLAWRSGVPNSAPVLHRWDGPVSPELFSRFLNRTLRSSKALRKLSVQTRVLG